MQDPLATLSSGSISAEGNHSDREMFLTNLSRYPSPIEELGHQRVHPTLTEFARASCKGFLLGLTFSCTGYSNPWLRVSVPASMALDTFVADHAKEISYDHEYAREAWEHEYNSIGEIDEYVAYATGRGIPHEKARDIALTVTSEPSVSIPYHLAFELGMLRPTSYKRKLEHAGAVFLGYSCGMFSAHMAHSVSRNTQGGAGFFAPVLIPVSFILLTPGLFARYRHVFRMKGSRRFTVIALSTYALVLTMIIGLRNS